MTEAQVHGGNAQALQIKFATVSTVPLAKAGHMINMRLLGSVEGHCQSAWTQGGHSQGH